MQQPEKVRAAFERDLGNKVLFIKDGKLLFIDGINLKAIADRKAYFASLRCVRGKRNPLWSWPNWDRTRHSPCGSSMSWATRPSEPTHPRPP